MDPNLTYPIIQNVTLNATLFQPWWTALADTIRTIAETGTAIGTIALSYFTFRTLKEMQKEMTPNIKIEAEDSRRSAHEAIRFTALNKGQRVVSLEKFELWLDKTEKLDVKQITYYSLVPGKIEEYNPPPHDLFPYKKYIVYINITSIVTVLKDKHHDGKVDLIGHFIDQIGTSYTSKPYKFDIDEASKVDMS